MKKIIGADSAKKLAGLQMDTLAKYRAGQLTLEHWEWWNNLSGHQRDVLMRGGAFQPNEAEVSIERKSTLHHLGIVTVPLASESELEKFTFETREGLWVEGAFNILFGSTVSPKGTSVVLSKHQLTAYAYDSTITAELELGYIFKGEAGKERLKQVIASLILAQWGGTEGTLLNNGDASIFYFEDDRGIRTDVLVNWYSDNLYLDNRFWFVDVCGFDDVRWDAGRRVLLQSVPRTEL